MVNRIKVLLLCAGKNEYHDLDKIGKFLKDFLITNGFEVYLTDDFEMFLQENIEPYDVILTYTVDAVMNIKQSEGLFNAVRGNSKEISGKPKGFVGIHSATTSFNENKEYKKMIGASFITHPEFGPTYDFIIKDKKHPITKSLTDFSLKDELYLFEIHSDFHTLISCNYEGAEKPIAWTKNYGKGRVFYTALGHSVDQLNDSNLKKMIINGIKWAAK